MSRPAPLPAGNPPQAEAACLLLGAGAPLEKIAEACLLYSPRVALRPGEAVFLETGSCRFLYSRETLRARLLLLARRFGFEPKIAFAADPATALALARFGLEKPNRLPLEALPDFAGPFGGGGDQAGALSAGVERLRLLGLSTLDEFLGLPGAQLGNRFPAAMAGVWQKLREGAPEPWPLFTPAPALKEEAGLVGGGDAAGLADLESLAFFLGACMGRLMARLRGRGLRLSALGLELRLEGGSRRAWTLRLPLPQGSAREACRLARERLAWEFQLRPLAAPAEALKLEALETAPGLSRQANLFSRLEEERERFNSLADRLAQKLGPKGAFLARPRQRYLPEASWTRVLEETAWPAPPRRDFDVPEPLARRPLRLLPRALKLKSGGGLLEAADGRRWRPTEWGWPERLSGEWWTSPEFSGFCRDYYRLATAEGVHLWVFRLPGPAGGEPVDPLPFDQAGEEFYLHGYFD